MPDLRPAPNQRERSVLYRVQRQIDKDKRAIAKRNAKAKVDRFLSYRGWVVALHANGHADMSHASGYMDGVLRPDLTVENLPKSIPHLNLDEFHEEYSREQIKTLKAELLRLVGAYTNPHRQNN